MNIAYVTNSRFPSEKAQSDQVMQMCSAFAKLGHEVTLFVPDRKGVVNKDPFNYYQREKSFTVERLSCYDLTRFAWLGPLGFWIQTASFIWTFKQRIKKVDVDVIYSRELYALLFAREKAQRVWESHSLHRSWWGRYVLQKIDKIFTLTNASREELKKQGVDSERIRVEPDAVDPELFSNPPSYEAARQKLNVSPGETLCLYVGKFTTMGAPKGVEESIQAIKELRQEGCSIRLLAVGATESEQKKYSAFNSEGIELRGHQAQNTLKDVYAAADILLMPFPNTPHYAYFMSPLKLFEYLISGVPIIASDLPSIREIVTKNEVYFVEPGSVPSLKQVLMYAIQHPDESSRIASTAKKLSLTYTWEARAKRIVDQLAESIG